MKIEWELSIGLAGCRIHGSVDVDDDADDQEIEETVQNAALERVSWSWKRPGEEG